jgi:hypothetical protein
LSTIWRHVLTDEGRALARGNVRCSPAGEKAKLQR